MEGLISRQLKIFGDIKSIGVNFKKDSESRKTPEYIQKRLQTLENFWEEFDNINSQLSPYENPEVEYFRDNIYMKTRDMYESTRRLLSNYKISEPKTSTSRGTDSELAMQLNRQRTNFRAFSRLIKNINIEEISEKWELEDELRSVQNRWNIIDSLHLEIDSVLQGEDLSYEEEYCAYEREFKNIKRLLNRKLASTVHTQLSTPKIEIPVFSGKFAQWPTFFDLYTEAIHNNAYLSSTQKMQHLKGKVKGEAERLIQHLHISSDNYDTAWHILVHRYNNKQLLFTTHMDALLNQPIIHKQSAYEIKKLHDTSVECIHAIHNLGVDTNTWDPILVHILSKKLDSVTLTDYKEARKSPRDLPELNEFITFLENKFIALEPMHKRERDNDMSTSFKGNFKSSSLPFSTRNPNHNKTYQNKTYHTRTSRCPVCNYNHDLYQCRKFTGMSHEAKLQFIAKQKICKNCLYKHYDNPCTSSKRCKECNGDHNSLLHEAFKDKTTSISDTVPPSPAATAANNNQFIKHHNVNHVAGDDEEILLTTVLLKVLSNDGTYITLRALLDQGSQISLISENAAQVLGLQRKKYYASVTGVGDGFKQSRGLVNLDCHSIYDDYHFTTEALIISKVINNLPSNSFTTQSWSHLQHVNLADPEYNVSRPIDLLLDASVYSEIIMSGLIKGPSQSPIAQQTKLGWILSGNVKTFNCNVVINNLSELSKYWEIEDINMPSHITNMSSGEQYCEDIYESTTKRLENGMYEVALPMKPDFEKNLGHSKSKALAQFSQLERKMAKNSDFSNNYKHFMEEYQNLGHMKPASNTEVPVCYLPHHGVLKLDSTSTKLRVVFNASSKTSTGHSLNDLMERGPNLQSDLQTLIITWRQYKYVMTADIEKMFRRIFVSEPYQHLQTILWRSTNDEPVQSYQLTTVTYGTKAAPYLAMRTLRQIAKDAAEKYPLGSLALTNSFYMDDYMGGHNSLEHAKNIQEQLINILREAGMNLRKWSSNTEELIKDLSNEQVNSPFEFRCSESRKTLGLKWNPSSDSFSFNNKFESPVRKCHTKRELLSDISKIFDPMGWLSPLTIRAKLLFQKAWVSGAAWDDKLPEDIIQEWVQLRNEFKNINQLNIPRHLGNTEKQYQLHGFCDASEKAYACAIYIVTTDYKGECTSTLVTAKTKLAPLNKTVSLPRLELCGALLLSQLMLKVTHSLSNQHVIINAWTDSMVVLGWIHGNECRWKSFVANGIKKIKEIIPAKQLNHVRSEDNPADSATRGVTLTQLSQHRLWWQGTEWLPTFKSSNIPCISYQEPTIEIKKKSVTAALNHNQCTIILELLNQHNSITRVARIMAWVLYFIERTRHGRSGSNERTLIRFKLNEAYNIIIKTVQSYELSEDINNIKNKGRVHKNSKLANLNPFIDDKGVLRVGGRLNNSNISWSAKHPIILCSHSRHNDVVLVKKDNLPPGKWAMGRVQELHPGKDGHVRIVSLKTKNNIKRRPKLFKNFFLNLVIFTSLFLSPSLQQQPEGFNITKLNNDQGLFFDKVSNLHYVRDEWKLVLYYNMSTYWQSVQNIHEYIMHIKETETRAANSQYKSVILQLEHELNEMELYNRLLKNQNIKRHKRGLINGVGYIANTLFGVLDERFAEQYQKDIDNIKQNENHFMKLLHNQTLIMEAEYNILRKHEDIMNKQFLFIKQHINNLTMELERVRFDRKNDMYIASSSLAAHIIISNIRRIQQTLIDTVTDINQGHINMHLLSQEQLERQIDIISGQLQGDLVLPVDRANIIFLYKLLKVSARVTNKYLIAEIKIPLLSNDIFELDKIISIPQRREKTFYYIMPTFPYIGFNIKKDSILFLSEFDVNACRRISEEKLLCSLNKPVYNIDIKQSICDIRLVNSGTSLSPCTSEVSSCKESWIKLHADNSWLFVCCEECGVRIICPAGVTSQLLRGSGVIHLGPMCTMKGNDFTIYSHNNFFNEMNVNQKLEFPEVSVLNRVMNTSAIIKITPPEDHEYNQLRDQIQNLKEQASQTLYTHTSHHNATYSISVVTIAIISAMACVFIWNIIKRRRARNAGPEQQQSQGGLNAVTVSPPSASVESVCRKNSENKATSPVAPRLTRFKLDCE